MKTWVVVIVDALIALLLNLLAAFLLVAFNQFQNIHFIHVLFVFVTIFLILLFLTLKIELDTSSDAEDTGLSVNARQWIKKVKGNVIGIEANLVTGGKYSVDQKADEVKKDGQVIGVKIDNLDLDD
ncbi:MAG: hypothetical protein L0154_26510 [Chloroflexi bacterium]|nr:hypothetical protein [Chloroflexota bacterium]